MKQLSMLPPEPAPFLAEIEAGALFVVNHSGGKDSQAMMIKLLEFVPPAQVLVVHASLGEMEWPNALEHAKEQADAAGVPFVVARAGKSLLEMVQHRFNTRPDAPSWPSSKHRQCTSDLKRNPIQREIRAYAKLHGFTRIVNCMGMRAQESSARAKKQVWVTNTALNKAGRTAFDWLPIHGLTTSEVFATIANAGQKPHPAYALGNERLSCVFCIMASPSDLKVGATQNPELYARYCDLEKSTGYTMHSSMKPLEELTGIKPARWVAA